MFAIYSKVTRVSLIMIFIHIFILYILLYFWMFFPLFSYLFKKYQVGYSFKQGNEAAWSTPIITLCDK